MTEAGSGLVLVRGRIEDDVEELSGWCEIHVAGCEPERRTAVHAFTIMQDDGRRVKVVDFVEPVQERIQPARTVHGSWAEVTGDALAGLVRDLAPGPTVSVTLRGATFTPGDAVCVIGRAVGSRSETAGGYRAAPVERVTAVCAEAIGLGPDGDHLVQRILPPVEREPGRRGAANARPRVVKPSRAHWLWLAAGCLAIGTSAAVGLPLPPIALPILGLSFVASALTWWLLAMPAARFSFGERTAAPGPGLIVGLAWGVAAAAGLLVLLTSKGGASNGVAPCLATSGALACLLLFLGTWALTRSARVAARTLTRPVPASDRSGGRTWCVVCGRAACTDTILGPLWLETDAHSGGGARIEVQPMGALWATMVLPPAGAGGTALGAVAEGAEAIVAGWLDERGCMAWSGPGSLLLFVAPAGARATDLLARTADRLYAGLIGLGAVAGASVIGAGASIMRDPRFESVLGILAGVAVLLAVGALAARRCRIALRPTEALVRLGENQVQVFRGSAWVFPALHRAVIVPLEPFGLRYRRAGDHALRTRDEVPFDLEIEVELRICAHRAGVLRALATLALEEERAGIEGVRDRARTLLEPKIVTTLRNKLCENDFVVLEANRELAPEQAGAVLGPELMRNGIELLSLRFSAFDITPPSQWPVMFSTTPGQERARELYAHRHPSG